MILTSYSNSDRKGGDWKIKKSYRVNYIRVPFQISSTEQAKLLVVLHVFSWFTFGLIRDAFIYKLVDNMMRGSYQSLRSNNNTFFISCLPAAVTQVQSVSGMLTNLPCNITPSVPGDKVNLVLWYKDGFGKPLYR